MPHFLFAVTIGAWLASGSDMGGILPAAPSSEDSSLRTPGEGAQTDRMGLMGAVGFDPGDQVAPAGMVPE
jgi:hypothetical protein